MVPTLYESAGRRRGGQHISREGSAQLRSAIIELGRGLSQHDPEFSTHRRALISQGKSAFGGGGGRWAPVPPARLRDAAGSVSPRPGEMDQVGGGQTVMATSK
ncbi:MAG: transposase, partial [Nocardioidaceae bacterium]